MKIIFNTLHLHHFLSFDDATIDLRDKGYCLIKGINNNPKDAARSNGSGKSAICNALSFALLGETISGLTSNLGNIYFDDGCYVELEFIVDDKKYNILRAKDDDTYGTNLKIFVDDKDESGKGIRESQAILDQLLPDINRELLGSVILLGQGLPDRFTANTPSRRKEVLEHLSKSDFMIQDLRRRIEERSIELNRLDRIEDDLSIKTNSEKDIYSKNLFDTKNILESISKENNLDEEINKNKGILETLKQKYSFNDQKLREIDDKIKELNNILLEHTELKSNRINKINEQFNSYDKELSKAKWDFERQISTLTDDIQAMKNIKDVCPTCGQKLPNVVKPDTRQKEADLACAKNSLANTLEEIKQNNAEYSRVKKEIEDKFIEATAKAKEEISKLNIDKNSYSISSLSFDITSLSNKITALEKDKESREQKIKDCLEKISFLENKLKEIDDIIIGVETRKKRLSTHSGIVSKMNTFIKRDFRGILLSNSINYINKKAKEYSSKIFNTDEIEFKLDGNNIDISFCNKEYENLSGGEKQRIDLITQFAIRDMISKNLGFSSNILFLDEITDNLDADSCDRVINFITNEFKDIESTFIISHHSDLDIPVDSDLVIIKDELGVSRLQ